MVILVFQIKILFLKHMEKGDKNKYIDKANDLFLPCKIIKLVGESEDEKSLFSLEISKATNSQKAIKSIDLKANAPEQVKFSNSMREVNVFYQTKRGEEIPSSFRSYDYLNADLSQVGKLCLAGIFQLPASSRSKPSTLYNDLYYNVIFCGNQKNVSLISRDLLYVDYFFRNSFLKKFDNKYDGNSIISFAHNSRTICISFTCLVSRILCGNISKKIFSQNLEKIGTDNYYMDNFYDILKDIEKFSGIFKNECFIHNKDLIDETLFKLFEKIIKEGSKMFNLAKSSDQALNETNYLKSDKRYFEILRINWADFLEIFEQENEIFR